MPATVYSRSNKMVDGSRCSVSRESLAPVIALHGCGVNARPRYEQQTPLSCKYRLLGTFAYSKCHMWKTFEALRVHFPVGRRVSVMKEGEVNPTLFGVCRFVDSCGSTMRFAFFIFSEISQWLLGGLSWRSVKTFTETRQFWGFVFFLSSARAELFISSWRCISMPLFQVSKSAVLRPGEGSMWALDDWTKHSSCHSPYSNEWPCKYRYSNRCFFLPRNTCDKWCDEMIVVETLSGKIWMLRHKRTSFATLYCSQNGFLWRFRDLWQWRETHKCAQQWS